MLLIWDHKTSESSHYNNINAQIWVKNETYHNKLKPKAM